MTELAPLLASYVRSVDGYKVPTTKTGEPRAYASGYKTKDFVLPVVEVNATKVEQYAQVTSACVRVPMVTVCARVVTVTHASGHGHGHACEW